MTSLPKDKNNLENQNNEISLKYVNKTYYENLKNDFEILRKGLEYYACVENWVYYEEDHENSIINRRDLESVVYKLKEDYWLKINTGGKKAREILKKIEDNQKYLDENIED
jgi:YHS domain-containing protein